MANTEYEFVIPPGERLDSFLARALADQGEKISRAAIQKQIEAGGVLGLTPKQLKPAFRSQTPLQIKFIMPVESEVTLQPIERELPILYEDEYLAIVHKPPGMTVHPGAGTGQDTMVHALLGQIKNLAPHPERPGIVHRLDRETEGIMVIAKTQEAKYKLSEQFAARRVYKKYAAVVWGSITLPEEIHGYIWRDRSDRKKMRFGSKQPGSPIRARTADLIVSAQRRASKATELELQLITGRTHQIRATLKSFNAPIVGDRLYGDDAAKFRLYKIGREKRKISACGMLLIAFSLSLRHPFMRRNLDYTIALPERFIQARSLLD